MDSTPRSTIANAAWNTIATISFIATSFVTAPVLIHRLGVAQYGTFLLLGSITGILSLVSFGLGEATLRYVAHHYGDRDFVSVNRVFGSTLSFYVVVSTVFSSVMLAAAPIIVRWLKIEADEYEAMSQLVRLVAVVFLVRIISSAFAVIPPALQRYDVSSKINIGINLLRTGGYIGLAIYGFGLVHLVLWDLAVGLVAAAIWIKLARRLLPTLRLLPSFSFEGLRETVGYSVYSFLTWGFHTMHRESGKLLLGRFLGTAPVAYLGTPDNIAQRLHMVVASGSETLVPRFGANRDPEAGEKLFWSSTWFALALSLILFIPFFVLVPDFLRLWISPEFARESGLVGQVLAFYLVSQGAFTPVATYFRGTGKPWFVTVVILVALMVTVATGVVLIPARGAEGAAYAYLAGSVAPFLGVIVGGLYAFGRSSLPMLFRTVGWPLLAASAACMSGLLLRSSFDDLTWLSLFTLGALLLALTAFFVVGFDWLLGGEDSPSRQLLTRIAANRKIAAVLKLIAVKSAT